MKIFRSKKNIRKYLRAEKLKGHNVGFVPTMGYLHDGHVSLINRCVRDCDICVVSIFVNPIQFGPKEDLSSYPRDFKRDKMICLQQGVSAIFYPSVNHMYENRHLSFVEVTELDKYLCGASRPGHFRGVTTVVSKLFNIVEPDIAYFGQKDIQQARIIEKMVKDLDFAVKIKVCPIVRERDGLAMSSRNVYLSDEQRREAVVLYQSLLLAKDEIKNKKNYSVSSVISKMKKMISGTSGKIDYIEIVDYSFLRPLKKLSAGDKVIIALAVWFGKARLIDNIIVRV